MRLSSDGITSWATSDWDLNIGTLKVRRKRARRFNSIHSTHPMLRLPHPLPYPLSLITVNGPNIPNFLLSSVHYMQLISSYLSLTLQSYLQNIVTSNFSLPYNSLFLDKTTHFLFKPKPSFFLSAHTQIHFPPKTIVICLEHKLWHTISCSKYQS